MARMLYPIGFLTFALAWLLPGHFFPWRGFQQETLASLGAALLALAAVRSGGAARLVVPSAATASFALALVPLLQWAFGLFPFFADALLPSLYLSAFAVTIVAGRALTAAHGDRFVAAMFAAYLVAALLSTGIGLAQWLRLGEISYIELLQDGGRIYGNFTQPNHLASLLGLGFIGVWWCYETRRLGLVGATLALVFIGFGVVMTQSRTSWVLAPVLALWWLGVRRPLPLRTSPLAVTLGLGLFVCAIASWDPLNAWLNQGVGTALADRALAGTRPIHWATLWDAAWRAPWKGYGWQQVGVAQQLATLDHPASHEWITFSHNLALDLMVWNGAVPGLLLSAAIAWWATRRLARCRSVGSWALLAAGGVLVIHALVEFPLAYTYFLLPLGVMVGAVDALEGGPPNRARLPRLAFAAVLALLIALLAWVWVEYVEIEDTAREMAFKEAGYVTKGPGPQVPKVRLLDNQREFLWFRSMRATPGMSEETLDRMKTLSQRFAPPAAMLRYALAAGLNSRSEEAARNLALICHMWPKRNCDEGRASWIALQMQYPQLASIPFPGFAPH